MLTVVLTALFGMLTGVGLWLGDVFGYGWSAFFGVLAFVVSNAVAGMMLKGGYELQLKRKDYSVSPQMMRVMARALRTSMGPSSS